MTSDRLERIREWFTHLQDIWEPAVQAALHGDFAIARKRWRKGEAPPPQAAAALEAAWIRLQTGSEGRLPKGKPPVYRGPLWRRDLTHSDRLRAFQKYEELRADRYGKKEALRLAVQWANEHPRQNPARLVEGRLRGKVTVDRLEYELAKNKTRRKLREPD